MNTSIRLIAECYNTETGEMIESKLLREDAIKPPVSIKDLGYLHEEQIALIQSIQDIKLHYETVLLNQTEPCPRCGQMTKSNGKRESNFHAALTDHKVMIQKRHCKCGWDSDATVASIYGSSCHPDLVEKQVIQGSENSYRQASRQLNAESKSIRGINNDDRIRRHITLVSEKIEANKLKDVAVMESDQSAKKLIAVIDGGHLKSNDPSKCSFEAMIATIYRPESLKKIDNHHNKITKKTSVGSALSDRQQVIKKLSVNACRTEGANPQITEITCLTDGASNCWSIAKALKPCCKTLINVLDWFHITKRFTIIHNRVDDEFWEKLEKVKWFLWHGNPNSALERLNELQLDVKEEKLLSDLQELYEYIDRNQKYIVNYGKREEEKLPFTSTLAESSVNALINQRQKNNKKMQWSREGAHNILQIRTAVFSKTWEKDWEKVQEEIYQIAA